MKALSLVVVLREITTGLPPGSEHYVDWKRFLGQSLLVGASRQSFSLRTGATAVVPVPGINQATFGTFRPWPEFFSTFFLQPALPIRRWRIR